MLDGDVAIQYQVHRDILHSDQKKLLSLQRTIASEGWGARFLSHQHSNGHWGKTFYEPKWISTHYTLLDLKTIGLSPTNTQAVRSTKMVLDEPLAKNGGIFYSFGSGLADVCVNGMILNFGSYFSPKNKKLNDLVDFLLAIPLKDGGWNCRYLSKGTTHSSLHSTLSVLEGLLEFRKTGSRYRRKEILMVEKNAIEFLLIHHLYRSHHTGKIIDPRMLRLSFPCRWRYDILRVLDYFRDAEVPYDLRMESALNILNSKEGRDGRWPLQENHKGQVHFKMEETGKPSRWNTLRAIRVLNHYEQNFHKS
jgi:hypothetical protein